MLRNKELRQFAAVFALIATAAAAAGFAVCPAAGLLSFASSAAFGAAFWGFTRTRYRSLARLSEEIDLVLHNAERFRIGESEEGELSILYSEITKMTLRIREQNDALKQEKAHLADSLADIAHQLRTPLTSLSLLVTLLENEPAEAERKALLREAEELLLRMDWLITALLKLSRLDAGIVIFRQERLEVRTLIAAALRPLLIPLELHDIALRVDIPDGAVLFGDANWLAEALQNILKNCMESAGDHGRLEIVCTDTLLYIEIIIRDNGAGFADEDLPCLFERFYRGTSSSAAGYGIGLALARTILARQGGSITAKNHPEGGALFTIRFPK